MSLAPGAEPSAGDLERAEAELVEQRRVERWISIRELAIALFVAALVAVRFALGV